MNGQWKEVVRLTFKGQRFLDHALDLSALAELSQFQKIVAETAKALWRADNSERERLPKHFEDRIRLCLRRIEEGSAVVPLEVYIEESSQLELIESEPIELNKAILLAHDVFNAAEKDKQLPEKFPKNLISEYSKWGEGLADDEEIEITAKGRNVPAKVNRNSRLRLVSITDTPYEDQIDVTGEVLEADLRQGRFQLWVDGRTWVSVNFETIQEDEVTSALKDHRTRKLRLKGKGKFSPDGKLLQVTDVESWELRPADEVPFDASARPIEDILEELASKVPREEWDMLPRDLSENLDHYLYGTPKR